jgi:hypothetical protein
VPMDRSEFQAHKARLDRTNFARHLRQADKAATFVDVTLAGVTLLFTNRDGESEVHYFGMPWVDPEVAKDIRKAVLGQLEALVESEK